MNLRAYIIIFIILLSSGQCFAGEKDNISLADLKDHLVFGKADILTEISWMADPSYENSFDLKEQDSSVVIMHLPGAFFKKTPEDGPIYACQPDPLLLDRPPPFGYSPNA